MKKTTLILIVIALTLSVNAQWYAAQYGVTNMNELNKTQLELALSQGADLKQTGMITTVITSGMLIVGTVMYSSGLNDIVTSSTYDQIDNGVSKGTVGAILMYSGSLGLCIGVPIWIMGAHKVNTVKVHLAKFDTMGYMQHGIGITFKF